MIKDQLRRIVAIEQGRVELPADIRAWLGDSVTDAELAHVGTAPPKPPVALSREGQRWLDERTFTGAED